MTGEPRRCALRGCTLRIDQMDEFGHRRIFCSPAHRTARRKQRLAERLETLRRVPPGELPPALGVLPPPALVRTPVRFVPPSPAPIPPGPWNPAAAWVVTETSPLQPPVSSRSRPAPRRPERARDAEPGAGRRVMASAALAGVLSAGAGYVLLQPTAPGTDRAPLPPGTERPSADADQHAVRAEVVLAALDRQLDAVQRAETDLGIIPAARRGQEGPAAVRALLARKSILEQQRAAVQSQLGALRELPQLTAELTAAQIELDAVDRELRQFSTIGRSTIGVSTIGVSTDRSLAEGAPQYRLELRRQQLDQSIRVLIDRRAGAQEALAAPLPDPADRTAPVVANVQRLLALPALGTSGLAEEANAPVDGSRVAGLHSPVALGYGVPVVAAVRGSALEGAGSPIVTGVDNPGVTDARDPVIALGGSPTAADFRSPTAVDGGNPAVVGGSQLGSSPAVIGGSPPVLGSGSPAVIDGGAAPAIGNSGPGLFGGGSPAVNGGGAPVVLGADSSLLPSNPIVPGIDNPGIDNPVTADRPPLTQVGSEPAALPTPETVRPLDELLAPRGSTPLPAISEGADAADAGPAERNDQPSARSLPSPADRPSEQFFPAGLTADPAPDPAPEAPERSRPVGKAERTRAQLGVDAPTADPDRPTSESTEQENRRPVGKAERARQLAGRGEDTSARSDDRGATDQDEREGDGPDRTDQRGADQNTADQNTADQDTADQDRADQDRAGNDQSDQDASEQRSADPANGGTGEEAPARPDTGDRSTGNGGSDRAGQNDGEQNTGEQDTSEQRADDVRPDADPAATAAQTGGSSSDSATSERPIADDTSPSAPGRHAAEENTDTPSRDQQAAESDTDDRPSDSGSTDSRRAADSDQSSEADQNGDADQNTDAKDSAEKNSDATNSEAKNSDDADRSDSDGKAEPKADSAAEEPSNGDGGNADRA